MDYVTTIFQFIFFFEAVKEIREKILEAIYLVISI